MVKKGYSKCTRNGTKITDCVGNKPKYVWSTQSIFETLYAILGIKIVCHSQPSGSNHH